MDNYRVLLSPKAKEMLDDHIDFLAQLNVDAAVNLKNAFLKALRSLETMPLRFPVLESEYIKFGKYRKIYQIKENTVYVDYIVDCRANFGWLLR